MRVLLSLLAIVVLMLLAGCDGDVSHDVQTGGNGSLIGMTISPTPQDIDISTDADFYLDWKSGYEPPANFTFTLEAIDADGSRNGVLTIKHIISTGHYRFEPTLSLSSQTFLLLTVESEGERVRAMYLTDGWRGTKSAPIGDGQVTHTIEGAR